MPTPSSRTTSPDAASPDDVGRADQANSRTPRRADAERNRQAIAAAAAATLGRDPGASTSDIAREAGVGRVTLYGHYPTRADLVGAAVTHELERSRDVLAGVDLTGDPAAALGRLLRASWQTLERARLLLVAAQRELDPTQIRELHADPAQRMEDLLRRGQREHVFRDDVPATWLVATAHHLLHGAADEVATGRLTVDDAPRVVASTVLAAVGAPSPAAAPGVRSGLPPRPTEGQPTD